MSTTFLVGVDGSEGARRAAEFAAERATREGAKLLCAYVVDWSPYSAVAPRDLDTRHAEREKEIARARSEVLDPLASKLRRDGLELETVVRHGHAAEVLCALATEHRVTQIFAGRRGVSKLKAMLFGSVSGSLVQVAPVPITIVP